MRPAITESIEPPIGRIYLDFQYKTIQIEHIDIKITSTRANSKNILTPNEIVLTDFHRALNTRFSVANR